MILRELFYFDRETLDTVDDKRYEADLDQTPLDLDDTRKTKLTLRQINRARKAAELHNEEQQKELLFVRQMYGLTAQAEAGGV